jgi:hypothetical protein
MTSDRPPRAAFAPGQISPELAEAALSCPEVTSGNLKCLDRGQVHDLSPVGDFTAPHGDPERSRSPVGMLADFGAVAWVDAGPHGMLWLTPLGRMLAISLFFGASPVPDASVGEVIELIGAAGARPADHDPVLAHRTVRG